LYCRFYVWNFQSEILSDALVELGLEVFKVFSAQAFELATE